MSLEEEEQANEHASRNILHSPTRIIPGGLLARMLSSSETQYILPDEYACYRANKGPRFIATKGIFTCISVFACDESGNAFAAHVTLNRLHANFWKDKNTLLPELTNALKWTFKNTASSDVKVHLAGGIVFT
jgi:hypothetical protein